MKQPSTPTFAVGGIFPVIVLAQLACTTMWFAGNAVLPDVESLWHLPPAAHGLVLAAVQWGFVAGTLLFAVTSLPDRYPAPNVFLSCALLGALSNIAIIVVDGDVFSLLSARFLTGFFLAGIYPVGMKIAASWCENGLGRALGYLVGALVLGTALPHLIRGLGAHLPWSYVIGMCSVSSVLGGFAMYLFVPSGPYLPVRSPFKISAVVDLFKIPQMRGAALGYFGHMWELYALWAYLPLLIQTYAAKHSLHTLNDSMGAFVVIGAGAVGCILGGELAKRIGSIRVAFGQLFVSGLLCIASPLLLSAPPGVFFALLVLWGVTAAGDSPQFSSLLGIGAPRQYVGTAFTVVNCVGFSISALSILVVGYLSNRFPPEFLFLALAPGPILGLIAGKGLVRAYANGKKPDTRRNLMSKKQPMILGIGGTLRSGSSSERALNIALTAAEKAGATVRSFTGAKLDLPHYDASNKAGIEAAAELLELYRQCDGVIISSPGYHGSTSGMIKNALDYIEELRSDERVYLEDRPVGCIVCAYGWQATGTTLTALRSIVHALRGWPTPLGVTINSAQTSFSDDGGCSDSRVADQLHALAGQVLGFASQGVAEPHSTAKST